MAVTFCPLASGSDGNSIYAGTEHTHILVDAGLSGKKIEEGLRQLSLAGSSIEALLITHEHVDHIKGAGILSRRYDIPIFATQGTWEAMEGQIGTIAEKNIRFIYKEEPCVINDICVVPFEIPHDAAEPVGYCLYAQNHKLTIATDLGHITDTIKENIKDAEVLLLESNHDEEMLLTGPYPQYLKKRIAGSHGHISNTAAGNVLAEMISSKLHHVYLGHLSGENNIPDLAYQTVANILKQHQIKLGTYLQLAMANRGKISAPIVL